MKCGACEIESYIASGTLKKFDYCYITSEILERFDYLGLL